MTHLLLAIYKVIRNNLHGKKVVDLDFKIKLLFSRNFHKYPQVLPCTALHFIKHTTPTQQKLLLIEIGQKPYKASLLC